jgi:hypothetical protein
MLHFFEYIPQDPAKNPGIISDKEFDWRRWRSCFGRLVTQNFLPLPIEFSG